LPETLLQMSLKESFMERFRSGTMKETHKVKSGNYSGCSWCWNL